tara:strand:- start:1217 stop:1456 length:240 start_codon:yes stop_codon:yes gene_type:complete
LKKWNDAKAAAPLAAAKATATAAWAAKAKADLTQEWDATTQKWFATWYTERCAASDSLDAFKSGIAKDTTDAHAAAVKL